MRKFLITVEGKQYDVAVEEVGVTESAPQAVSAPAAPAAPVAPAAAPKAAASKAAAPANGTKLTAPMPGLIVGIKVEDGATVKKGQTVLVLEAMKMENDISAPCDGVISFKVQKGANVDTGALLAVIG